MSETVPKRIRLVKMACATCHNKFTEEGWTPKKDHYFDDFEWVFCPFWVVRANGEDDG